MRRWPVDVLIKRGIVLAVVGLFLWLIAVQLVCRYEMATCERELRAMIPPLRAYALAHDGCFPKDEMELSKVIGKPLSARYTYKPFIDYNVLKMSGDPYLCPIIIDEPHFGTPVLIIRLVVPNKRIHMLLNDLTIHHAQSLKEFT
jgi:hypothetical protein